MLRKLSEKNIEVVADAFTAGKSAIIVAGKDRAATGKSTLESLRAF